MTGGKKMKYPRGHAKIKGKFGRMKFVLNFYKKDWFCLRDTP